MNLSGKYHGNESKFFIPNGDLVDNYFGCIILSCQKYVSLLLL